MTGRGSDEATTRDERLAMLAALVDGDVPLAYRLATELLGHGVSFDDLVVELLGPLQGELGRRWAAGELGIADEHAASAVVEEVLVRLGATGESPSGPTVVVACAEDDSHALGARVVAAALSLDGFRVLFLGASLPAEDLAEFLGLQQPLALALSCSMPTALVGAARSVAVAHDLGLPVVAGGRVVTDERAARLGADAHARVPRDAVAILRAWELSPPDRLAPALGPIPEQPAFAYRSPMLVGAALRASANGDSNERAFAHELERVLRVVEAALVLDDASVISEHVEWLRDTGPAHGFARERVDAALRALADAMNAELTRGGDALRMTLADVVE